MDVLELGENMRRLRLQKGVTQEKMAEVMGVSAQAVSRWETCAAYPDIELLPRLAGYFGVTVDALMGAGGVRREEMTGRAYTLAREGKMDEAIALCREGLERFPGDSGLTMALCETLARQESPDKAREAVRLGEKVLRQGDITAKARSTIAVTLIFLYRRLGEGERLRELTMSLPHLWECREALMGEDRDGEEYERALRVTVKKLLQFAAWKIENRDRRVGIPDYVQLGFPFGDFDEKESLETIRAFLE